MAHPCSFPHSIKEQGNELSLRFNSSRLEMKSAAHYSRKAAGGFLGRQYRAGSWRPSGKHGVATAALITVDGLLVEGVDKVARVLNGVLEVAHGVSAAAVAPQALFGRLGLILQLAQPGLVWTGHTHTHSINSRLDSNKIFDF